LPIKAYYNTAVSDFLVDDADRILGVLTTEHHHALEEQQRWAWLKQISILKTALTNTPQGRLFLEFYIPRMGKRVDALLVAEGVIFVLEFKVGAKEHLSSAIDQVVDYALDLKNFHEGSHTAPVVPILVSTDAESEPTSKARFAADLVALPLRANSANLGDLIDEICANQTFPSLNIDDWMSKGYKPTPTIVEAAEVLYRTHNVTDISRRDAGARNLRETTASVGTIIDGARKHNKKAICFVTGVPGSGKTLAGLNFATHRSDEHRDEHAVFLSGNDPLVDVLREALARDKAKREKVSKKAAHRAVRSFIQNIRHFRDSFVANNDVPVEKVVVFDEAQRAWTLKQAASFMKRKRGQPNFNMSEPEFLISVMDRHPDWCTIVCLVGGGQEINTGEAGISEWIKALETRFPTWEVHVSPRIALPEYGSEVEIKAFLASSRVYPDESLHLAVSMRSFRAEALSNLVGHIMDNHSEDARTEYKLVGATYPIYLTRSLDTAKAWLRERARGTERFGLVASSGALRLRPEGIFIKARIEPENWFLNDNRDVRSSFYLEDVASEFAVQGLELDWVGVCWDADLRHRNGQWVYQTFAGSKWKSTVETKRPYLKNAYRVLLTRARQYLRSCGIPTLD
jgi:hypothetical protein